MTAADPAAAAAAYARQGLAVVPCWGVSRDGRCGCGQPACDSIAKHPYAPLAPRGCYSASRDPDVVARWWAAEPAANVAIATGRAHGLLVLDVDAPHGGEASLAALEQEHGPLPRTWTVRTPRGGRHYYFALADDGAAVPSPASVRPGVDIRADGAMAVAPPSRAPAGAYTWEVSPADLAAPAPCPPWLVALARAARAGDGPRGNGHAASVDWAQLLAGVPEGARNQRLFEAACRLRRAGVPRELAAELLHALAARCQPPLAEREVQQLLASAWRYAPPAGDSLQPTPLATLRARYQADVAWLVPGYIARGELTLLVGPPESLKSWAMADLARAVLTGGRWLDQFPVPAGGVLYVEAERARNLVYQLTHLERAYGVDLGALSIVPPGQFSLTDPASQAALGALVRAQAPVLVVINSLRACFSRGDLADGADIHRALGWLGQLAEETHAAIVVVDGTNKAGGLGHVRGMAAHADSLQKEFEADCVLHVERERDPVGRGVGPARVYVGKRRHGEPGAPFQFAVEPCGEGAAVRWCGGAEVGGAAPSAEAQVLAALRERSPQRAEELAAATGLAAKTVANALSALKRRGLVVQPQYGAWALPPGDAMPADALSRLSRGYIARETRESDGDGIEPEERASDDGPDPPGQGLGAGTPDPPGGAAGALSRLSRLSRTIYARESRESDGDGIDQPDPWPALQQRVREAVAALEALGADAAGPPPRPCFACRTQRWYRPRADCPEYWVCRTCHPPPPAADARPG